MGWLNALKRKNEVQNKPNRFLYSLDDLHTLDGYYETMFRLHQDMHREIIDNLSNFSSVLEVACGTGWCIPLFQMNKLEYTGIDICETAIAACALKFPDIRLINASIGYSDFLAPRSFDAVYSSSMLEHIGRFEEAISSMWRLARHRMDLMFFEGLSDAPEHSIKFFPYDQSEDPKTWGGEYGMKVALQDHGPRDGRTGEGHVPGYFYNRYSSSKMLELLEELPSSKIRSIKHSLHQDNGLRSWVTILRTDY